MLDKSN